MKTLIFLQGEQPFPEPEQALDEPNGLLAVGGDLTPQRLKSAYYRGIFPWFNEGDPILWWSPDPRAVFQIGSVHLSHSLKKVIKKQPWKITVNRDFPAVISNCAQIRNDQQGTWITTEIQNAYVTLHEQKQAHSIEVWLNNKLVGGLYGINVGKVFCGESMFHKVSNASKVALVALEQHLAIAGYQLIDAQISNPHLTTLGAQVMSRNQFLLKLSELRDKKAASFCWETQEISIAI